MMKAALDAYNQTSVPASRLPLQETDVSNHPSIKQHQQDPSKASKPGDYDSIKMKYPCYSSFIMFVIAFFFPQFSFFRFGTFPCHSTNFFPLHSSFINLLSVLSLIKVFISTLFSISSRPVFLFFFPFIFSPFLLKYSVLLSSF